MSHLVRPPSPLLFLPGALGSSCFLQQGGDHIVRNVEELLVDLLILSEIVVAAEQVRGGRL